MEVTNFSKEMGVTHADFFRLLPRAMGDTPYQLDDRTVRGELDGGTVSIHLGDAQVRRIALLRIPYAEVSFSFSGVDDAERLRFMQHFDLHFQRGGG